MNGHSVIALFQGLNLNDDPVWKWIGSQYLHVLKIIKILRLSIPFTQAAMRARCSEMGWCAVVDPFP
jgi:hypothetical protein